MTGTLNALQVQGAEDLARHRPQRMHGANAAGDALDPRAEDNILLRKKTEQLKEILNWTKTAHDVYRMTKEVNATQKKTNTTLEKVNVAATRQKIIGRIKGARGRKHMAVH